MVFDELPEPSVGGPRDECDCGLHDNGAQWRVCVPGGFFYTCDGLVASLAAEVFRGHNGMPSGVGEEMGV